MGNYGLEKTLAEDGGISILTEDVNNSVKFSSFVNFNLFDNSNANGLLIPYSSIKVSKSAAAQGIKQSVISVDSRHDNSFKVKSALELWGFSNYMDYIYTVCELTFLEGLIPTLDIGFISPSEMSKLMEVVSLLKIRILPYSVYQKNPDYYEHHIKIVFKLIECACRLGFPVSLIITNLYDTPKDYLLTLIDQLMDLDAPYEMIHDIHLKFPTDSYQYSAKDCDRWLAYYQIFSDHIREDVLLLPTVFSQEMMKKLLKLEVNDFGDIFLDVLNANQVVQNTVTQDVLFGIEDFEQILVDQGLLFQQRFPLRKQFIKDQKYSSKLGQVFDSYRYKIKKDKQLKK